MKSWLPSLTLILCASAALAEPPAAPKDRAAALVQQELLAPMHKSEAKRKRFSRAAPVAIERRVRVLDETLQTDARGKQFVRFAVDVRRPFDEDEILGKDAMQGCAYPEEGKVFVRVGSEYVTAKGALNGRGKAPAGVCEAVPQLAAATTPAKS